MKRMLCLFLAAAVAFSLAACGNKTEVTSKNMSQEEAEHEIEAAMQYLLEDVYGDKITDARIYVEKVYMTEDEQKDELVKSLELGPDEYAFSVKYEMLPAEGVDPIEMTAATGIYDEESGWILEKYNVGVLRPNEEGEPAYVITDFGTGF